MSRKRLAWRQLARYRAFMASATHRFLGRHTQWSEAGQTAIWQEALPEWQRF